MSTKDEIFEYVMKSPENTNPAVLRSMLNGVENGNNNFPCTKLSITKPQEIDLISDGSATLLMELEGNLYKTSNISEASYILPGISNDKFYIEFAFGSPSDDYIVTLNGQEIPFTSEKGGGGNYYIIYESEIYPTEYNIIIINK